MRRRISSGSRAGIPAYADHDAIKDLDIDDEIEVTWYEDTTWSILLVDGEQVNDGP